jgi:hypothetical protein
MWPERFGAKEAQAIKAGLGPYMASGRLQQSPQPKGGGAASSALVVAARPALSAYQQFRQGGRRARDALRPQPLHAVLEGLFPAFLSR